MPRDNQKRDEKWAKFEAEVLRELRKARQRELLSDRFDKMEEVADEMGKAVQAKLLASMAEEREPEGGQRCPECEGAMQRRGKSARQLKTSQGTVRVQRERWGRPECGASLFPLG